ncbi:hypothetical protein Pelo_9433 [Pelomyxa schiedti]|nr:hypothetical protein Pelo_9433 [Pelomyxa schiedti]
MADQNPPSSAPPPVEKPAETAAPKAEPPKADAEAKPVSSNRPAKKSGTKPPPAAKPKAEKAPPSAEAQAAAAAARARAEATPPFWAARNELFEQLRVAYVAEIEARPKTPIEVKVLPPKGPSFLPARSLVTSIKTLRICMQKALLLDIIMYVIQIAK